MILSVHYLVDEIVRLIILSAFGICLEYCNLCNPVRFGYVTITPAHFLAIEQTYYDRISVYNVGRHTNFQPKTQL